MRRQAVPAQHLFLSPRTTEMHLEVNSGRMVYPSIVQPEVSTAISNACCSIARRARSPSEASCTSNPSKSVPAPIGVSERWQKAKPTSENVVGFLMSRRWMPFVVAFRDFSSHSIAWGPLSSPRAGAQARDNLLLQRRDAVCVRAMRAVYSQSAGLAGWFGVCVSPPTSSCGATVFLGGPAFQRRSSWWQLSHLNRFGGPKQIPCRVMIHSIVKSGEERSGFLR